VWSMKQVVVFVTAAEATRVRNVIGLVGEGRLGNYRESTLTSTATANRALDEQRIEFACDDETFTHVLDAIDEIAPGVSTVDSWNAEVFSA
jgi:hypothetical protein